MSLNSYESSAEPGETESFLGSIKSSTTRGWLMALGSLVVGICLIAGVCGLILGAIAVADIHEGGNSIDTRLDDIERAIGGLTHKAVIAGSHPTKKDVNVKETIYIGHNAVVNNTIYARDGIVSESGGASFNASVVLSNGDVTVENGGVTSECNTELAIFNVSSLSSVSIARGDVVGLIDGEVHLGFQEMHDTAVTSSIGSQTQNIYTFSLSDTRVVNLFLTTSNILNFQLVTLDEQTLEPTVYTSYDITGGVAFDNDFTFVGIGYDGDDSRFMVFYTDPTSSSNDVIYVVGVRITALAYPVVTFDQSSATAFSGTGLTEPCISDVGFAFGTTYYGVYSDDTGVRVRAFTAAVSGATWTFTMGTVATVDSAAAVQSKCFVGSSAVITSTSTTAYVALTWGGGDTTYSIRTNVMLLTSTTWTAIAAGNEIVILSSISTSNSRHQTVALPGGTQYAVGVQASSDLVEGALYTFSTSGVVPSWVDADHLAAVTFNYFQGDYVSLLANPDFDIVNLGGSSTAQRIGICYQGSVPTNNRYLCQVFTLDAGVFDSSSNLVAASNYLPGFTAMGAINDTAFSFVYTAVGDGSVRPIRFGIITIDDDGQPAVSRTKPQFPLGIATTDADAGDSVTVLLRGCITDADLFDYVSSVQLCLHGDGTIQPTSYYNAGVSATYVPICSCAHIAGGRIFCDYAFTRSTQLPFYNTL